MAIGYVGALPDMELDFWVAGGELVRATLLFALDTAIRLPSGPFDASKGSKIEYTVRNDNIAANADIWGVDSGFNYGRMRTADFRSFRGNSGGNIGEIAHVQGVQYDVTEEVVTPGTCTVTFDGLGSGDATVGATGADVGPWQIGGRVGGQGIIGVIKDFKIYDESGTLLHHWPINDNVADGGEITDIVGGLHGTLTLGAGQWETSTAPTVEAGGPYNGTADVAIPLDGTVTPGSDPAPVLTWSVVSGPDTSSAQFSNTAIEDPTFTPSLGGAYVLRLSANPSDGGIVSDTADLTATAVAPTVDAGGPYSGDANSAIALNGTVTPGSDPAPTLTWSVTAGPDLSPAQFSDPNIEDPTFTPSTDGAYTLQLEADPSDDVAVTDTASLTSVGFSPEVQAVLDRMKALDQTMIDAIEVFVDGLVADGIWALLDDFWCFALNPTDWLTGWKAHTATLNGVGISQNKDGAICGDTNSQMNTNAVLNTLTNYQLGNAELGCYIHSTSNWGTTNNDFYGVDSGATRVRMRHRGSDTVDLNFSMNSGGNASTPTDPLPIGNILVSLRDNGTNGLALVDGVQAGSHATPTAVPATAQPCWVFATNQNGAPQTPGIVGDVITSFYVGAQIDTVQFLTRLNVLHTSLGVTAFVDPTP
jgi:hypothetical protein